MAIKKKIEMQGDVFSGISSVFAVVGGFATTKSGNKYVATLGDSNIKEFPVSDDSGFNFDSGAPSVNHFKVQGLNTDWVNTFTPGDGQVTLEIPCNDTDILETVYGRTGKDMEIEVPGEIFTDEEDAAVTLKGKGFTFAQKAIYLGLLILNDTEDKVLYIKKAKFMAQTIFDGSNKPLCVVLTGTLSAGGDVDAFGILERDESSESSD